MFVKSRVIAAISMPPSFGRLSFAGDSLCESARDRMAGNVAQPEQPEIQSGIAIFHYLSRFEESPHERQHRAGEHNSQFNGSRNSAKTKPLLRRFLPKHSARKFRVFEE